MSLFAFMFYWGHTSVVKTSEPMQIEIFEVSQPSSTAISSNIKKQKTQQSPSVTKSDDTTTVATTSQEVKSNSTGTTQVGIKDSYTRDLLILIHQRKVYPRLAQKMGHSGRVLAQLRVAQNGHILDSQILEHSPYVTLNEAANKLIKSLPQLKPFPDHVKDQEWVFHIPIDYKIE